MREILVDTEAAFIKMEAELGPRRILSLDTECFQENTLVVDERGRVTEIGSLSIGQVLPSFDERSGRIFYGRSTGVLRKLSDMLRIRANAPGADVTVAENHLFWTPTGWRKATDLRVGDEVAVPTVLRWEGTPGLFETWELRLLGLYTAESYRTEGVKCTKSLCRSLLEEHGLYGKYAHEKEVPESIFKATQKDAAEYLRFLFTGDGTVHKNRAGVALSTSSMPIAYQVQSLLLRSGIMSGVSSYEDNRKPSYHTMYTVSVYGQDAVLFSEKVGFYGRKQAELEAVLRTHSRRSPRTRRLSGVDWGFSKIQSTESVGRGWVACPQMTPRPTIVASGFLSHNTNKLDVFDDDFEIVGISLAGNTQTGYYIPVGHRAPPGKEDVVPKQLARGWVMTRLNRFLSGRRMSGANHKFDQHVFGRYGTCMGTTTFDVLLAAPVLDSRDAMSRLDQIVFNKLGYKPMKIEDLCAGVKPKKLKNPVTGKDLPKKKQRMGFEFLTTEEALPYAAADAVDVARLRDWFVPKLKIDASLSRIMQIEIDVLPVLKRMEDVGVLLDEAKVRALNAAAKTMEDEGLIKLRELSGNEELNPKSGKQMGDIIYHQMGIPHPRGRRLYTRGGTPPKGWLEKETREHLVVFVRSHQRQGYGGWSAAQVMEFLETYTRYNAARKFRSTYTINLLDLLASDGRLHTELRQIVQTGRSASSSPNLQNLPRADDPITKHLDLRAALYADDGWTFVKADYAAQEMRIIAALSRDPTMMAIFTGQMLDERGDRIDIHAYVGSQAFDEPYLEIIDACRKKDAEGYDALNDREKHLVKVRQDSKPVNFGIAYGITAIGLAVQIKSSERMAQKLINAWRTKSFPHAARWMDGQVSYLRQNLCTQTALGRKRRVSPRALALSDAKFKAIARQFVNHPVQGSAADMTKQAMVRVDAMLRAKFGDDAARMVLVIHDELIVRCREEVAEAVKTEVKTAMATELLGVEFPVDGEIAKTMSKKAA